MARPALVVIDMQKRWIRDGAGLHPSLGDAVEIMNHVADVFRRAGRPVIWIQDAESMAGEDPDFAVIDALEVQDGDVRVAKVASNAFAEPGLPDALEETGADFALLCGYRAEQCVLATARGAADRGLPHAILRGAILSPASDAPAFVERITPLMSWELAPALADPRA